MSCRKCMNKSSKVFMVQSSLNLSAVFGDCDTAMCRPKISCKCCQAWSDGARRTSAGAANGGGQMEIKSHLLRCRSCSVLAHFHLSFEIHSTARFACNVHHARLGLDRAVTENCVVDEKHDDRPDD